MDDSFQIGVLIAEVKWSNERELSLIFKNAHRDTRETSVALHFEAANWRTVIERLETALAAPPVR